MEYCIVLENIHKYYDNLHVLDNICLHIKKGAIYGLLGPNGAGKTTTIRIINGVADKSQGNIYFNNEKIEGKSVKINSKSGVLTENAGCYESLTAMENLKFFGRMFNMKEEDIIARANYLLGKLGLEKDKNRKVKTFSTGMKKRVHLARALLHNPEILFLDEPTSGLDPETSEIVTKFILELVKKEGKTVLICTHQLKYAEEICTDYGFINKGKLIAEGTYEELLEKFDNTMFLKLKLSEYPEWLTINERKDDFAYVIIKDEEEVAEIINKLVKENIKIYFAQPMHKSLTQLYFDVIEGENKYEK